MTTTLPSATAPRPAQSALAARTDGLRLTWEAAAYLAILILAIFTRFYMLGDRVMSHDESLHTKFSYELYNDGRFQHSPLMHGPVLFHATAFAYFMFGDNDFSSRIYPAVLGVIMTVGFPLLFRRWLGRWGALLLAIMMLISPLWMYYNRYIREDTPNIFAAFLMVYCFFMYIDGPRHLRRRARWLYICAAAMLWMLASKETGFLYIAVFGSFMTLYFGVRLYQHFRRVPARSLFYMITISSLLGGTAALIMYIVISIALQPFPTLEERGAHLASQFALLLQGQPISIESAAFINWTLIVALVFIGFVIATFWWVFRRAHGRIPFAEIAVMIAIALVVCLGFVYIEELSQAPARAVPTTAQAPDEVAPSETIAARTELPIIAAWVASGAIIIFVLWLGQSGFVRTLYRFRELDMMILMGTLILPWLTPIIIKMTGAVATDYSAAGIQRAILAGLPLLAVSIVVGAVWNWRRFLIYSLCFWVPFVFFFTTMFTNPNGLWTGVIGSLGYWLEQQGVRRGSQPQYYYQLIVMPMYEYLPLIGSVLAMLAGMVGFWRFRRREVELVDADRARTWTLAAAEGKLAESDLPPLVQKRKRDSFDPSALGAPMDAEALRAIDAREDRERHRALWLTRMPFMLFMAWLSVMNLLVYTLAGEKMPWLGTHLTIPLMFLTAWYFGTVFSRTDWSRFRQGGWIYLIIVPLLVIAGFQVLRPLLTGVNIFGLLQSQLEQTGHWLAALAVIGVCIYILWRVARSTGGLHLRQMVGAAVFAGLALMTFRAAWVASFINYDYANEFLVYAHGAPGFTLMMDQVEEISRRTTNGLDIRFAWGGNAWPASWYFRHLRNAVFFGENPSPQALNDAVAVYASADIRPRVEPLLEDRYMRFDYTRMWWPMQDYFGLTAQRVQNILDFSAENRQAAVLRQGLFDIWWARDYTRYGEATGGNFSLSSWPVSETMSLYVRRDIAAQIWSLGTGEGTAVTQAQVTEVNQCVANWQQTPAEVAFEQPPTGPLNNPIGIAVQGSRVLVADEFGARIVLYDTDGRYITEFRRSGAESGAFNRPNGVAFMPGGGFVVADTWNYRVQVLDGDGQPVTGWGQSAQLGYDARLLPLDGLWGPRAVAVDAAGSIYVADTGNKRIRVYDRSGTHLRDIGSGGGGVGQLNEPAGLAITNSGQLYVADTWNRRVSVFTIDGTALFSFPVRGWYDDLGNRPYLAVDEARSLVYVTDPDAGRVLVYTLTGDCVGSFGQPGAVGALSLNQFGASSGIALDAQGRVFVVDSRGGRVLRFPAFVVPVEPPVENAQG